METLNHKCAIDSKAIVDFTVKFLNQEHSGMSSHSSFYKETPVPVQGSSELFGSITHGNTNPMYMPPPGFFGNLNGAAEVTPDFQWANKSQVIFLQANYWNIFFMKNV